MTLLRSGAHLAFDQRFNRRRLFALGFGATAATLLAACGGTDDTSDTTPAPTTGLNPPQPSFGPQPTGESTTPTSQPTTPQRLGKLSVRTEPYPQYSGTPVDGDILTLMKAEELGDLAPTALNAYTPLILILDPLIFIDEFSMDLKPWLADRWEAAEDGKHYTLSLRDDVRWHDGTPFTVDDAVFSLIANRDDPYSAVATFYLDMADPIVRDARTIEITLSQPLGTFLSVSCNQFVFQKLQLEAYWATNKTLTGYDFAAHPLLGTGAWKQTGYQPAEGVMELARNVDYWVGAPHFNRLIFRGVTDSSARLLAWKNGDSDLLWPVSAADIDAIKDDEEAWLYACWAAADMEAWFNFENPRQPVADIFTPLKVRQALMHAIDRDGYAAALFKGFVDQNAYGTVPYPWAYNSDVQHYDYDPERALAMLAEEGWSPDGDTLRNASGQAFALNAIVSNAPSYPIDKIAESMQEDFRQIGIALSIDRLEWAAYLDRYQSLTFDLEFSERIHWAGFADFARYHSSFNAATNPLGYNYGWTSSEGDRLVEGIQYSTDRDTQKEFFRQFQSLIAVDLPALWLGFPRDLILVRKNILGYQPNIRWRYWDTWTLWRDE